MLAECFNCKNISKGYKENHITYEKLCVQAIDNKQEVAIHKRKNLLLNQMKYRSLRN